MRESHHYDAAIAIEKKQSMEAAKKDTRPSNDVDAAGDQRAVEEAKRRKASPYTAVAPEYDSRFVADPSDQSQTMFEYSTGVFFDCMKQVPVSRSFLAVAVIISSLSIRHPAATLCVEPPLRVQRD